MDPYKPEVSQDLSAAGKLSREQVQQKTQRDRHARDPGFRVGNSVFVLMSAKRLSKAQICKIIFQIHIPVFSIRGLFHCIVDFKSAYFVLMLHRRKLQIQYM